MAHNGLLHIEFVDTTNHRIVWTATADNKVDLDLTDRHNERILEHAVSAMLGRIPSESWKPRA